MLLLIVRFSGVDGLSTVVVPGLGSYVPASAVKIPMVTSQTLFVGQSGFDTPEEGSVSDPERQGQRDAGEVPPLEGSVQDRPADPEAPREKSGPNESFHHVGNKRHFSVAARAGGELPGLVLGLSNSGESQNQTLQAYFIGAASRAILSSHVYRPQEKGDSIRKSQEPVRTRTASACIDCRPPRGLAPAHGNPHSWSPGFDIRRALTGCTMAQANRLNFSRAVSPGTSRPPAQYTWKDISNSGEIRVKMKT